LSAAEPGFSERTTEAGLTFVHRPVAGDPLWPQSGGGTVGDFDGDGWPDLFVLGGGLAPDALFINNGDGTFTDRAADWGVAHQHRGSAAIAADYDGDGWQDLFVTSFGDADLPVAGGHHRLYRNQGNGLFAEVAEAAGVRETTARPDSYGATFGDYDLDGDLDLFVAGWGQFSTMPHQSRLFRNEGDGTFSNVTIPAGIGAPEMPSFGGIFADMNGDRYPELLVAADIGLSRYFSNNRDGTFTEIDVFGPDKVYNGMGSTIGDVDRDGLLDWFITAIFPREAGPPGNRLYMNNGQDSFSESTESTGVHDGGWGWGTATLDADHDGWLDIVMTNGWPFPDPEGNEFTDEPARLYRNNGDGTFTDVAQAYGLDHRQDGRGLVHLDFDRDGDMDVVVFSYGDALRLYRNDLSGEATNWLQLELESSGNAALAPHGLGSRIEVRSGGEVQYATLHAGSNYLGRSQLVAHFGLEAAAVVDELIVTWPDGFATVLRDVAVNQILEVAAVEPLAVTPVPMVRGESADWTVRGLSPGETAYFFSASGGAGEGPCYAFFGGLCVETPGAVFRGSAIADDLGEATLTITVPPNPWFQTHSIQALIRRGPAGSASLKTNLVTAEIVGP
jgi:hypothetical protein